MFHLLARLACRRGLAVVVTAVLAGTIAGIYGAPVSRVLVGGGFDDPRSDSSQARAQLAGATGVDDRDINALVTLPVPVTDAAAKARVAAVAHTFANDPAVATVIDPLTVSAPQFVAADQRHVLIDARWKYLSDSAENAAADRLQKAFEGQHDVALGGFTLAQNALETRVADDLGRAEKLAFPLLFILLILVFRSAVAAMLPLMVAGMSIVLTFSVLRLGSHITPLSVYALNTTTGLGLGLAIDASLLMVSRFREEIDAGRATSDAVAITLRTAGRTVAFSAVTVASAMAALLVFPERFLYSMGIGGVTVTLVAATVTLVVLPAVLALLGRRVDSLAWRPRKLSGGTGAWYRLAHLVMRRPLIVAFLAGGFLLLCASPVGGMKLTYVNVNDLPDGTSVKTVAQQAQALFPSLDVAPLVVSVDARASQERDVTALAHTISSIDGVGSAVAARPVSPSRWEITAPLTTHDIYGDDAVRVMRAVRSAHASVPFVVGGDTAVFVDLEDSLTGHVGPAFAIIALAILVVLWAATGSVVLPFKAVAMNLLSLAATFGFLVAVFQWGWFAQLLGFSKQPGIETTEPVLIATVAFGLSTDYGVFLLTRIKEMHDRGSGTRDSVAHGLERTGRVVTAAALLFCVAIGSFATSGIVFIKQVGLGSAFAVLVDATVVRAFLVPALMAILGDWNWWSPRPLRALHRMFRLDRIETAEDAA